MTSIEERRAAVVREAMEWEGTPYVPNARVKGRSGGCDCLTFLAGVYENVGEIPKLTIPYYPPDFHLHSADEYYLRGKDDCPGVLSFCQEVDEPLPGDVVLWKFGLQFSHSGIVIKWPIVIHAFHHRPVGPDDALKKSLLCKIHEVIPLRGQPRPRKFFTLKGWI